VLIFLSRVVLCHTPVTDVPYRKQLKLFFQELSKQRNAKTVFGTVQWLRRLVVGLSGWRPKLAPRAAHVGSVVDKVAIGQGFLRVLRFSLSISFHCGSTFIYQLGDEQ
jgi:hypothetical protein